ncbi:MAG: aerobic carbon-monoxide dehydrogenase large subunit, partial [Pseudonocardiales bacterium]|nr:aerobic carbon-monoxide dehydrogenase large subunit [Pseudonocardiales bacterium]
MTAVDDRATAASSADGGPKMEVGNPRRRKEDAHLLTGRTTWTDNMTLPGMLHLAILRSPMAHAKITRIDASEARSRPGVIAVFTGQDFAETQGDIPCAWPVTADMVNPGHPSLAVTQVNHVGEAVAVIVARDKAAAQDALEAIDIDYQQLPAVLDMEAALAEGADLVHPNTTSNKSYTWVFESGAAGTGQPIDEVLNAAEVSLKRRFFQQRLIPAFMEPRSTVVQPVGEGFTMWSSTQVPHILRTMLALTLAVPEHKVRVIAPDVGGGFGGKLQVTPEEVICALVARKLGKPVKYTESRSESVMSGHHGRDQIQDVTITARRDGTVTGLDVHLLANMGAYLRLVSPG